MASSSTWTHAQHARREGRQGDRAGLVLGAGRLAIDGEGGMPLAYTSHKEGWLVYSLVS